MRRAPVVLAVLLASTPALAEEPGADDPRAVAPPAQAGPPRPFLWVDDASLPREATAYTRASYTQSPPSARPFVGEVARRGALVEAGAEAAVLPRLALTAAGAGAGDGAWGASGGVRVALVATEATRLAASAGASRTLTGAPSGWARVAFEQDVGRFRFGGSAHGEHVFAAGRDGVDLLLAAGASAAIVGPLRAGAEWVGQDLEAAVDREEADGGMRHFAGPTASVELLDRRLTIGGGPSFGISPGSPAFLGRVQLAYAF